MEELSLLFPSHSCLLERVLGFSHFYCIYITIPHTKLFVNNQQRVFIVGESVNLYGDVGQKYVSKYIIFPVSFASQGVSIRIDGARLPQKYICK
jgi:hypothetical protein